ncbi:hypothetical protein L6164_028630 [Bauhinia variegata]|uniref:Uncharacterized protein n=1 Tax=Bauhinia variegata TaxID=167791 RepID=A0ACB9L6W5_BAUVA|nr:hypothetical protein L6164_028630 [Bauhinia variegata]
MKNTKKKKKRSCASRSSSHGKDEEKGAGTEAKEVEDEEKLSKVLEALVSAFSLSSLEEAASAYRDAGGDADKAAEILRRTLIDNSDLDPSTCSTSSGTSSGLDLASSSGSSEGYIETSCVQGRSLPRFKQKKVIAATGTISTVLGKEYVRRNSLKSKGYSNGVVDKEEAEQFLFSMLGNDCDLSIAVVRDVLCQCGYNIDKALDVLLELSASSNEQLRNDGHLDETVNYVDDMRFVVDRTDNLMDRRSECTSFSSDSDFPDSIWSLGPVCRNYAEVLSGSEAHCPISSGNIKSDLPQKVLESLFNIPQSAEHDKETMNWRNVVKKMQSLGPKFDFCPQNAETQQRNYAKGDEYNVFREDAKKHWDSMRSCYQKAAAAYTKGERAYAAYLSDQGKEQIKRAKKAEAKASHDIFVARNKGIENVLTIDLHGQQVKPAMRMLKLHLLFGSYVPSVRILRVITGCGSHGMGKSKLKQLVIKLLEKEAVEWSEENRGTVLIKLNGYREFSFLDKDNDSDSD